MKAKIKLSGAEELKRKIQQTISQANKGSVAVGYTADYAIYVHEMINANFRRPGAKAKFLEAPFRELKDQLVKQIENDLKAGIILPQALFRAGLTLQRASMEIVPVGDTGNLRASAFTRVE